MDVKRVVLVSLAFQDLYVPTVIHFYVKNVHCIKTILKLAVDSLYCHQYVDQIMSKILHF